MIGPQAHWLPDGRRLHLQHGPIDLILAADGDKPEVQKAFAAAVAAFDGLLERLVTELPGLRRACPPAGLALRGPVARRMEAAVCPLAERGLFITPMAAVAGAVAEQVLAAMVAGGKLHRAFVNNGGDIAYHLSAGHSYRVALAALEDGDGAGSRGPARQLGPQGPQAAEGPARFTLRAAHPWRGLATSGRGGRSFSLGIADSVTVLARTAALADAAATIIGNAVDLPGDPAIVRQPACALDPDSDLGARLVVTGCAALPAVAVAQALDRGRRLAEELQRAGLIGAALLRLQQQTQLTTAAPRDRLAAAPRLLPDGAETPPAALRPNPEIQSRRQAGGKPPPAADRTTRKVATHA